MAQGSKWLNENQSVTGMGRKYKLMCGVEIGTEVSNNHKMAKLKALYLNAHSVCNRIDELKAQIEINEFDFVTVAETELQGDQDLELNILGYLILQNNTQKGH